MSRLILTRVRLQNIRSHVDSEVRFDEGFNCVVGGVGAGKTSILLAIHFALFGEPLFRGYDYLLREDRNWGTVELEFEHAGKTYKVFRGLTRGKKGRISQNPDELFLMEDGRKVAWGKVSAIQDHLKEVTGLDKPMFEGFIWVQQERLKEILNMPPRDRQSLLDELFGLADFQKAREKLHYYGRKYKFAVDNLEKDADVRLLPELSKERDEALSDSIRLQVELETVRVELKEAEERLRKGEEEFKRLERLEAEVSKLKEEKARVEANLSRVEAEARKTREELKARLKEAWDLEARIGFLEAGKKELLWNLKAEYGVETPSASELSSAIEELKAEREWLREQASKCMAEASKAEENLKAVNSETCPTCRQPLSPEYRETLLSQLKAEAEEGLKESEKLKAELSKISKKLEAAEKAWRQVNQAEVEQAGIRSQLEDVKTRIAKLEEELKRVEAEAVRFKAELANLQGEISKFRVEDLEEARKRRDDAKLLVEKLRGSISHYEERIADKDAELRRLEARIDEAQRKLGEIKRYRLMTELVEELRAAYGDVVPALRTAYVEGLRAAVQSVVDSLTQTSNRSLTIEIDEEYTPTLMEDSSFKRGVALISGGERTWLSLAYRIGLGQLVFESRTGQPLELLILDEPTEALGAEDGSIDALANAILNLKAIRQIITVTHSEELAKMASKRILVEKRAGTSLVEEF